MLKSCEWTKKVDELLKKSTERSDWGRKENCKEIKHTKKGKKIKSKYAKQKLNEWFNESQVREKGTRRKKQRKTKQKKNQERKWKQEGNTKEMEKKEGRIKRKVKRNTVKGNKTKISQL